MTGMDLTESIAPKSDQLNAEDLLSGPRTFTIAEVKRGSLEQPVDVHLVEFPGRPFKPSKTVRRLMVKAWGPDASTYVGRRLRLYRDPEIMFGRDKVGGIRLEAMSHIDRPLAEALTVTRGKRQMFTVQPLPDAPAPAADLAPAAQLTALVAGLAGLGITDRDAALAAISQVIQREVGSTKELTRDEADHVLEWIKAEGANTTAEPTLPGAVQ